MLRLTTADGLLIVFNSEKYFTKLQQFNRLVEAIGILMCKMWDKDEEFVYTILQQIAFV